MAVEDEDRPANALPPADPSGLEQDGNAAREQLLLTATVDELRERAERLHRATEELADHNERLRAAQRALEDERARYRELFDLAPDAFLLTDAEGHVVEANAHAAALLGGEGDSVVGKALLEFVDEASREDFRDRMLALAKSGGRRTAELRVTPRARPTLDVEATVATVPHRGDGGALLWLLRDVTERVVATRSLGQRLSERTDELERTRARTERERVHLRDLLQRLQEGVVAVDAGGVVVYANGPATHFFLPARLVEGEALPEPWPSIDLGALVGSLFKSRPRVRDIHVTTGNQRVLSVRGIPALGAETAGLLISDVSTRERRERAEREFVANAAHELRTPLTAITGAIEVLQAGAKEDATERDRFLEHIERESARLGRLSTALLVLARAQMGVESPRLEVVPIRPILELVAEESHPASGVTIEVSCQPDVAVFANRTLLEQAVTNLASNAAKQTHDGTIWLRGIDDGNGWVALEVADTGTGIPPEAQLRAAERFYRAGGAEGFGLGLAIATESARALGGRLELDSEPGRGTTARIVLPSAEVVRSE
jgi:PAS domain S-box-containing protein